MNSLTQFQLSPGFLRRYEKAPVEWGPLGLFAFARTYSRPLDPDDPSKGQERWKDTVARVVNGCYSMQKKHCWETGIRWDEEKGQRSAQEMFDLIFQMKFTPPGRGLWMMGSEFLEERGITAAMNCSFVSTGPEYPLSDSISLIMDLLMHGVGVGSDVRGAGQFEIVVPEESNEPFIVEDSREGWVAAARCLVDAYLGDGPRPVEFDMRNVRPAGAPIKTFGGVASGPEPLAEMLGHIEATLRRYMGKKIDSRGIADLVNLLGKCVVAGGVRRSAELLLGDPSDKQFLRLKSSEVQAERPWYWASNNSILADDVDDFTPYAEQTFSNGEPGYFFLGNAQKFGRMIDPADFKDIRAIGSNPCVTGDTLVLTAEGLKRIDSLLDKPFQAVVHGKTYDSLKGAFVTGRKRVFRLSTKEGFSVDVTYDHKILVVRAGSKEEVWIPAGQVGEGDKLVLNKFGALEASGSEVEKGWLLGCLLGDGHFAKSQKSAKVEFWGDERLAFLELALQAAKEHFGAKGTGYAIEERGMVGFSCTALRNFALDVGVSLDKEIDLSTLLQESPALQRGILRGLFDTDGSLQGTKEKGVSLRLSSTRLSHLEFAQLALSNLGIISRIYQNRRKAGERVLPDGKGGQKAYSTKANHELVISKQNLTRFFEIVGTASESRKAKFEEIVSSMGPRGFYKESFLASFESFVSLGEQTVYDCTIEEVHRFSANGIIVHNCVEQTLENREACNLVETYISRHRTLKEYKRTLKFAYLYAKTVTLGTCHHASMDVVMKRNRRIGTSIAGIIPMMDRLGQKEFTRWLDEGYKYIDELDRVYSAWFGVPLSIKKTSVKPGGTTPLLPGVTPGIHADHAPFYMRRANVGEFSPLLDIYRRAGYPVEPSEYSEGQFVITFPVQSESRTFKSNFSVREQVEMNALIQRYWADNQVSQTVDVMKEEAHLIAPLLFEFRDQVKSLSFLPTSDHGYAQAPYEEITEQEYQDLMANIRVVKESDVFVGQVVHDTDEKYCDGDKCTL